VTAEKGREKANYFPDDGSSGGLLHPSLVRLRENSTCRDDMAMKMQTPEPGFVDGL
jgi:hypothetical protein